MQAEDSQARGSSIEKLIRMTKVGLPTHTDTNLFNLDDVGASSRNRSPAFTSLSSQSVGAGAFLSNKAIDSTDTEHNVTSLAGSFGQLTARLKAELLIKGGATSAGKTASANAHGAIGDSSSMSKGGAALPVTGEQGGSAPPVDREKQPDSLSKAIEIEFEENALSLDADAIRQLDASLAKAGADFASRSARLVIFASEFSESKRLEFLRAVAIRNYLLKRGMKPANIAVSVMESRAGAPVNAKAVHLTVS